MNISNLTERVVPMLTGAVGAIAMQTPAGWWLNSGSGVGFTLALLFALGVLFGCKGTGSRRTQAISLWVGSMTGLAAVLGWIGPPTLWPIVLLVSSLLTACAVIAGEALGEWCR